MKSRVLLYLVLVSTFICTHSSAQEIVLNGKELFGDLSARQIGPAVMSGRVVDLEGHPSNSRVLYVGAAGGGVWKSNDGGASFKPIFDEHAQSIGVISVDPKDPDNVVWVGTGETFTRNSVSVGDGLYKTNDGGQSWNKIGFEKSERISSIEIHPENTDIVYVGVLGALWGDSEERGVYKTTDGGLTWEKILYTNEMTGCADVVLDPSNPEILYASMWEFRRTAWSFTSGGENSALFKSTDGGTSWNKIHNGLPTGNLGRIAFAVAPSDPSILYSVIETKGDDKGLYRSNDAGNTWEHQNNDFGLVVRPFYFSRIVVDPRNPEVVAKAGVFGSISRDGGKTFKNLGSMHPDIHDILFDINDSDRMYVATDGGVYRSWDGATTMEIVKNLPLSQFYHISVDNEEPYNIYGGLQDNGCWYGPSRSPGGIRGGDWTIVGVGDGFRVLRHAEKRILYSEMQSAQSVWRYDMDKNLSKTVQPLAVKGDPKLRFNWNAPMALSPTHPDRFYMGSQFLHRSEDMGNTWTKISPDLTTNDPKKQDQGNSGGISTDNSGAENHCTLFTIAESPLDDNIIWVGTDDGNVQITQNGGQSWENVTENIPGIPANLWVYEIKASSHNSGTAYAVFDGHTQNDMNPYVYKTEDFGKTWISLVSDEIYGFTRTIEEDYVNPDLLYLGTEFGLFITNNGGKKWNRFTNNMPAVAVHAIALQRQSNDLVLGTHGRGVIIIDDISPLREITQEVLAKDVHFLKIKPTEIVEESGFSQRFDAQDFVGPNPSRNVRILYYLKKRPIFGKMSMEIQDMDGNLLAELPVSKSKGINIVNWNYRIKPPKIALGKSFTRGAFTPARVPAGRYKVVLNKGKESYETEFELVNDPNSILSEEERAALHTTTMKLYDMSQNLAYLVFQVDQYLSEVDKLTKNDAKAAKSFATLSKELNQLKGTLVITEGDNYVDSRPPQLREEMATLYGKVAGGFNAPSSSELENLKLLEERYTDAVDSFESIKKKRISKLESYLEKTGATAIEILSFEEFLDK